jgi:hypothetical protein
MVHRRPATLIGLPLAIAMAACAAGNAPATDAHDAGVPPDVSGELILTRQRDLLDRGLINVLVRNRSSTSLLVSEVALDADFFDAEPAPQRTISVRTGRDVAIQVPYGDAIDCESGRRVAAELAFSFTTDDDRSPQTARLDLAGTDILDRIRTTQCTARRFDAAVRTSFANTRVIDGAVVADLVIEPTESAMELGIVGVSGTILIGVRIDDAWTNAPLTDTTITIPLRFVVNRCDPHALAEVTKRYGLDIAVTVDGGEPVEVGVDVTDLLSDFEHIVDDCVLASGAN